MTNIGGIGYRHSYVGKRAEMGMLDEAFTQELPKHIDPPKKVKVATGCPLCDEIWSSKEAYQNFCEYSSRERIVIVMEDGKPWLYIPCADEFYSDTKIQINYCPKCGRKLVEE